eukprot:TRINITY_DN63353_c0_g1_i1.p1 TRINITY_DN63353_c0_g1~~TRINITY_DN63353_c0_g1_i1.p1  ORF type:complete len:371 (-),score=66.91 TRINITY_DN63353_c0_g1_i1:110-1222(-)
MTVLSTRRAVTLTLSLGAAGIGTFLWNHWYRYGSGWLQRLAAKVLQRPLDAETQLEEEMQSSGPARPQLKTRINNFKISKVKRMTEGIAEDLGAEVDFDWNEAKNLKDTHFAEDAINTNSQTEWERQVNDEQTTFFEAARICEELRQTETHRKLPHFYVVDRQLTEMAANFREISEDVLVFPWRECRDEPMAELMSQPFMQLAKGGKSSEALLPVSQGFVKQTGNDKSQSESEDCPLGFAEDLRAKDEALLGIPEDADRSMIESRFRQKARDMHEHGQCVRKDDFHALNNAYGRCLARLIDNGRHIEAYAGGGDILAHYLLVGTDPSESRYGEAVSGLLDALQRERLVMRLSNLRIWGEDERSGTGLGQG